MLGIPARNPVPCVRCPPCGPEEAGLSLECGLPSPGEGGQGLQRDCKVSRLSLVQNVHLTIYSVHTYCMPGALLESRHILTLILTILQGICKGEKGESWGNQMPQITQLAGLGFKLSPIGLILNPTPALHYPFQQIKYPPHTVSVPDLQSHKTKFL